MLITSDGITPWKIWAIEHFRNRHEFIALGISEFLGSLILCLFCVGASAQYVILGESFIMPVLGGIFGLMISVAVVGGFSGAHINPAITFTFALSGEISWFKVPLYWFSQMLGSFTGAGIGYILYKVKLERHFKTDDLTTIPSVSGIFSPFPASDGGIPLGTGLGDQIVGTACYLMAIYSVIDPRNNNKIPPYLFGLFLALVVGGIACAFGINAGGVLNPGRDLAPRLMAVAIGWKIEDVFMYTDQEGNTHHYWLIPLIGPFVGAVLGSWTYIIFIGANLKNSETVSDEITTSLSLKSRNPIMESFTTLNTTDSFDNLPQNMQQTNNGVVTRIL